MINSIIIARSSADRHDVSCESQIQEIREEAIKRNENIYKTLTYSEQPTLSLMMTLNSKRF